MFKWNLDHLYSQLGTEEKGQEGEVSEGMAKSGKTELKLDYEFVKVHSCVGIYSINVRYHTMMHGRSKSS